MPSRGPGPERPVNSTELATDRPGERLCIHQLTDRSGVQFWSVAGSERYWGMLHDTYTACWVLGEPGEPRGSWRSRGVERTVASGCVQLMEPGESHRTTAVAGPASFFVVWWSPDALSGAARELGVARPLRWKEAQLEPGVVGSSFAELERSISRGDDALEIELALVRVERELVEKAAETLPSRLPHERRHPGVRRAVEALEARYTEAVCLDELAEQARLSKYHLAHCFQEATGFAPHQYLKRLRLRAARRHLERGLSVENAAVCSGFSDGPHLVRAFREWLGVTPGAFGRAVRSVVNASLAPESPVHF